MDESTAVRDPSDSSLSEPELYNALILNNYLLLLKDRYPEVEINALLEDADIHSWEISDPAKWFTQKQVNSFHAALNKRCSPKRGISISREAGQYSGTPKSKKILRQLAMSVLKPGQLYDIGIKIINHISRAMNWESVRTGENSRTITVTWKPEAQPQKFQCENIIGSIEGMAMMYYDKPPRVEHSICCFEGENKCVYEVEWDFPVSAILKRIRNIISGIGILSIISLAIFWGYSQTMVVGSILIILCLLLTIATEMQDKKEIIQSYQGMDFEVGVYLLSYEKYFNIAQLVGDISGHLARHTSLDKVVAKLSEILNGMGFNRGHIFFVDQIQKNIHIKLGYRYVDYDAHIDGSLNKLIISKQAFNNFPSEPKMIRFKKSTYESIPEKVAKSIQLLKYQYPIYIPIRFEKTPLGFFIVENTKASENITTGDINMLTIVASLTSLFITNIEAMEVIIQSEKSKMDFVSVASHEMRTPIQLILMALDELKHGIKKQQNKSIDIGMQKLEEGAERLSSIANSILDLGRIESLKGRLEKKRGKVSELIELISSETNYLVDKHKHKISYSIGLGAEHIYCDMNLMVQVMINLIENAAKYTPSGGTIIIDINQGGAGIEINVIDNGRGIPETEFQRIFMKFYQIGSSDDESDKDGSGLGLALCKEVITQHGGFINVTSPLSKEYSDKYKLNLDSGRDGSKFTVFLPPERKETVINENISG